MIAASERRSGSVCVDACMRGRLRARVFLYWGCMDMQSPLTVCLVDGDQLFQHGHVVIHQGEAVKVEDHDLLRDARRAPAQVSLDHVRDVSYVLIQVVLRRPPQLRSSDVEAVIS